MDVSALWVIYILTVLLLWLIFWAPFSSPCVSGLSALFYGLLLGFLVIFLISPAIDVEKLSPEEKAWFHALLAVALILPLIAIALMIAYVYERMHGLWEGDPFRKE